MTSCDANQVSFQNDEGEFADRTRSYLLCTWRDHAALRRAFAIAFSTTYGLLHTAIVFADDRGFEPLLDEVQNPPIDDALGHHGQ